MSRRRLGALAAAAALAVAGGPGTVHAAATPPPVPPFCGVVPVPPAWAFGTPWQEDLIPFGRFKLWYRDVNNVALNGALDKLRQRYTPAAEGKLPVLVVAGGPGLPHDYLDSLELMAAFRRVVFYDAVGSGRSYLASGKTGPLPADITTSLALDELDTVCRALGLLATATPKRGSGDSGSGPAPSFHIYGQGTGGMLALQYAAQRRPPGLASLTLASVPDSYAALVADRRSAAAALGQPAAGLLLDREGDDSVLPDFRAAMQQYSQRYVSHAAAAGGPAGSAEQPAVGGCVAAARRGRSRAAFEALAGGRLFSAAGWLAGWEAAPLAAGVGSLPVLVCRGSDDEVSPASAGRLAALFPAGLLQTVAGAGSYMHIDAWEPHLEGVEAHLTAAEGSQMVTGGGT